MEINEIIRLMEAVSANGLTSLKIEEGNLKLTIKKEKAQTAAGAAGVEQVVQIKEEASEQPSGKEELSKAIDSDRIVSSPLVGTFYNAPSPDSDPFVKVGDPVKKGQVLGIIEAMKLMNEIESDYDGIVEAILVSNEDVVEYGQPLFRIR